MKISVVILNKYMARRESWDKNLEDFRCSDFLSDFMIEKASIVIVFDSENFIEIKHRFNTIRQIFPIYQLQKYLEEINLKNNRVRQADFIGTFE